MFLKIHFLEFKGNLCFREEINVSSVIVDYIRSDRIFDSLSVLSKYCHRQKKGGATKKDTKKLTENVFKILLSVPLNPRLKRKPNLSEGLVLALEDYF